MSMMAEAVRVLASLNHLCTTPGTSNRVKGRDFQERDAKVLDETFSLTNRLTIKLHSRDSVDRATF